MLREESEAAICVMQFIGSVVCVKERCVVSGPFTGSMGIICIIVLAPRLAPHTMRLGARLCSHVTACLLPLFFAGSNALTMI